MTIILRMFALAFALLLLAPLAAADPVFQSSTIACVKAKQYSGGAATTPLVTSVPGQQIYVCGFVFEGTAAGSAQLEYGATGTNCSSPTAVTPAFGVGAAGNPGVVDHQTYYAGLPAVPSGSDLCVLTTGTATQAVAYYAQF